MQRNHRKKESGVVIVIALFIVALVAVMATTMITHLERDTRRTTLLLRHAEAEFYAQGSLAWAINQLNTNWEQQKTNQRIDNLPLASPVEVINHYTIASVIEDAQARFNINNVLQSPDDFTQLLKVVAPKLSDAQALEITRATVDWVTPQKQQNEYTQYYAKQMPPYRAAHRLMVSSSEWRLVKGVSQELFEALQPYLIALPMATPINVQTARAPVLATLSPSLTMETGLAIESIRKNAPFDTPVQFLNLDIVKNHKISDEKKITVNSMYFLVETTVSIENQQTLLYTLLERKAEQGKVTVKIIWQSKGQLG